MGAGDRIQSSVANDLINHVYLMKPLFIYIYIYIMLFWMAVCSVPQFLSAGFSRHMWAWLRDSSFEDLECDQDL